jgi:hypothetical protein
MKVSRTSTLVGNGKDNGYSQWKKTFK